MIVKSFFLAKILHILFIFGYNETSNTKGAIHLGQGKKDAPKFGLGSVRTENKATVQGKTTKTSHKNKQDSFGVGAIQKEKPSIFTLVKEVFLLESVKFWLIYYIVGIIFYYLHMKPMDSPFRGSNFGPIFYVNILLFPFTVLMFREWGQKIFATDNAFSYVIFGSKEGSGKNLMLGCFGTVIVYFARFLILGGQWFFSFILGLISFISLFRLVKKINM